LEDKVVKFPDRDEHHVFLEPEGRETYSIYPNGISNSLPREVQRDLVHSIPGLAHAEFMAYAYAIEYESIDARELKHSLESKRIPGLFFAGQVNGTTGYEEAAAQGFIAGVNAACRILGRNAMTLHRDEGYMGVLIDDLVLKGADEPYRMFTSRAERRLILRQDNARFRLHALARRIGLADPVFLDETEVLERKIEDELSRLASTPWRSNLTLWNWIARPENAYVKLPAEERRILSSEEMLQIDLRIKYAGYIAQEERAVQKAMERESVKIPEWVDYRRIAALRYESREKLSKIRPVNLGQASRIPGVTPADIAVLSVIVRRGPSTPVVL
jgi:tRNA uridine 5-carboxymethylaminomethyl modification enzyme